MKKRIVSALLCIVMLLSVVPMTVVAEDEVKSFTDVEPDAWYTEPIYYCVEKGYFTGTSEVTFGPGESMTRAMFVTVLAKYAGAELSDYTEQSFSDVAVGKWYHAATEWAYANGYVAGIGEGVFGYKNIITHQEIIAVLYSYVEAKGVDMTPLSDYRYDRCVDLDTISSWATDAMAWAGGLGLLDFNGHEGNMPLAAPKKPASRATVAYMLKTLDEALEEKPVPTLTIAGNDISLYTIVTSVDPLDPVKDAAKYFVEWTEDAYGVTLPVVTDETEPTEYEILLGKTNREDAGLVTVERDLENKTHYTVSVQGNRLVIAGNVDGNNNLYATRYGVFDLFEKHLGHSFLADDMILFDGQSHEIADDFFMTGGPGFESRVVYLQPGWNEVYNNDESYYKGMYRIHELPRIIDPSIDFDTATRMKNPCMTSEYNIQATIDSVLANLERDPTDRIVWLTQSDTNDYCECDDCMEIINANDGRPSAAVYYFCNRVYDAIAEAGYEDTYILTLAYLFSKRPPTNMEPNDHIIVYYCPIDNCIFCAYNDESCPINCEMKEDIERWSELCNRIYVWDYTNNFNYLANPYPNFDHLVTNNNWFYEMGVRGAFNNGDTEAAEFANLRAYLLSKLYYTPDMTQEEFDVHKEKFLEAFYGAAWRNISEYMDMLLEFSEGFHWNCNFPTRSGFKVLQFAVNKDKINALWDEVESLAQSDEQLYEIQRSRLSCTFMIQSATWYTEYLLGTPAQKEAYKAENQRLWDDLHRLEFTIENDNNPIIFSTTTAPMDW